MKKWVKRVIIIFMIASVIGISVYKYLIYKVSEEITKQISELEELAGNSSELEKLANISIENKGLSPNNESLTKDEKINPNQVVTRTQGNQVKNSSPTKDTGKNSAATKESKNQSGSKKSRFGSKQEAIRFGLSKFSASEINRFRKMASDGLTPAEKAEIKRMIFSRFSQSEITEIQRALSN